MNIKKATIYMILSAVAFAIMQVFVKMTADKYGVFEQVFIRNFIIFFMTLFIIKQKGKTLKVSKGKLPLLLRCVSGFLGIVFFFYSMKELNLADASALHRSSPFFVTLFSYLILKENISKIDVGIIILAFIGVLFVIKPNFQLTPIPSVAALMSAVLAGLAYVMISYLGKDVDSEVIILYFSLFSTFVCLPIVISNFVLPTIKDIFPLIGIGIGGGMGQFLLTKGYKLAPPGKISVYNFTNIIVSAILGYLIYKEELDKLTILGISLIILAAILSHIKNNNLFERGQIQ